MEFRVVLEDNSIFTISFIVDQEVTFCSIFDSTLNFAIATGHTILSPNDSFDTVEGMKRALKRALDAPPELFDRDTRSLIWESFWGYVEATVFESEYWDDAELADEVY